MSSWVAGVENTAGEGGSWSVWEHSPIPPDLTPWQRPQELGLISCLGDSEKLGESVGLCEMNNDDRRVLAGSGAKNQRPSKGGRARVGVLHEIS